MLQISKVLEKYAVMNNMAEIKLDLINLISYLKENSKISEIEVNKVNSIFTQCDTICEDGTQGADGKLTKDEVRTFF